MDSLTKLLTNGIKALVISFLLFTQGYAKTPIVLATNYLVQDLDTGEIIAEKNSSEIRSIASITKVMTALIVLDAGQNLEEKIKFQRDSGISSKLPTGANVSRRELMILALMSSDNGAAKTLAKNFPGGEEQAIRAMNETAQRIGMQNTQFADSTGLHPSNTSTASDLLKLIEYAAQYQEIREFSTKTKETIKVPGKKSPLYINFNTTNYLVATENIILSKTGWIRASGGCLVMITQHQGKRLAVILLNSRNTITRIRDGLLLTGYNNVRN